MSTPVDGFRRNLHETLPDLLEECEGKVKAAEAELDAQKDALKFVLSVMHGAGIERKRPPRPELVKDEEPRQAVDA